MQWFNENFSEIVLFDGRKVDVRRDNGYKRLCCAILDEIIEFVDYHRAFNPDLIEPSVVTKLMELEINRLALVYGIEYGETLFTCLSLFDTFLCGENIDEDQPKEDQLAPVLKLVPKSRKKPAENKVTKKKAAKTKVLKKKGTKSKTTKKKVTKK
jgi:hypothetical protein